MSNHVIEHAQHIWTEERAAIERASDAIVQLVKPDPDNDTGGRELSHSDDFIQNLAANTEHIFTTSGSPVVQLIGRVWDDLRDSTFGIVETVQDRNARAAKLLNNILVPMTQMNLPHRSPLIEGRMTHDFVATCASAEDYFDSARKQGETGSGAEHAKVSIYHNEQGHPIILRKCDIESSGLTLEPIAIGQVVIPAGTIVALGDGMSATKKLTGHKQLSGSQQCTYLIDKPAAISPNRLSAWAFEGLDKTSFAVKGPIVAPSHSEERLRLLEGTSLDDFRHAAQKIMEKCGVESAAQAES